MENEKHSKQNLSESISPLAEQLARIFSNSEISEDQKKDILKAICSVTFKHETSAFSGPIPPPEFLKGYNEIISAGAERIFSMAEKQLEHQIKSDILELELENHRVQEELKQSKLGQIFGFCIGLIGMSAATALAILGREVTAGIFATTTILGLVTVFVLGQKFQQQEIEKNNESNS